MHVVLTGGGGFIGSNVMARMIGAGIDVTLVGANTGRSRYTASLVAAGAARFVRCGDSYREDDVLSAVFADADALVLLGYVLPTGSARTASSGLAGGDRALDGLSVH